MGKPEEILKKCELDMEECLVEMGNQQELLGRLRETGFYDSSIILEAIGKIDALREKLNGIQGQIKEVKETIKYK